jgi:hypothetical protein
MDNLIILLISIVAVESITEVVVKSYIMSNLRNYLMNRFKFLQYLLTCGYCFSFWATFLILILLVITGSTPKIMNNMLNIFFIFFIIQRGSNIMHGMVDRYFDTRKDIRYNREKE